MNERWKYQIKKGLIYGLVLSVGFSFFDYYEKSIIEVFLSIKFLIKFFIHTSTGIIIVGYFMWKEKVKRENIYKS